MGGGEATTINLQRLLQSIISSDVLECRTELINQLGELDLSEKSEFVSLIESLTIFWDDSTCLDVSQCMLNKAILRVAAKYLEKDISECLEGLLSLGTKASIWTAKHFSMTLTSMEESQEEHSSIFFQLVLELLSFSAASFSTLSRSPVVGQKVFMATVELFIIKQLNLAKTTIAEIKTIHSVASEVLKVAQEVLNAAIRLCRAYHQALNSGSSGLKTVNDSVSTDDEKVDHVNHITRITTCTIDCLYELGILAAGGGGSLVSVLNVSWKGLVTLLQLCTGDIAAKVSVTDILLTLISLATESLKCAAESWSKRKEDISSTEAKRAFVPVKFYLINAVRILSLFSYQAFTIYKEVTLFGLMVLTFGITLSKDTRLKASSEALTELLEPTSCLLFHTLLNTVEMKEETKFEILDWLFTDPKEVNTNPMSSMAEIFTITCEAMPRTRMLLPGRVVLFLNLLKNSPDLSEDARLGISRKLVWLFDCLIDDDVYSNILDLQFPVLYGSGSSARLVWQPMYLSVLHALKTFMVVVSSSLVWEEVETFLLGNLLHPHFFLRETVMELWCFIVRHADIDMVNDIIDKLFSLLNCVVSSESVLIPGSALRMVARSICVLLSHAPQSLIDQVYSYITSDDRSPSLAIVYVTLLIEGFPLDLLSDKMKKLATQRIITGFHSFMETNNRKLRLDHISKSCSTNFVGAPVYALSSALRCLLISSSDIDAKTLKFTLSLIQGYKTSAETLKDTYCKLLNQTLAIISNSKHLYTCVEMEEIISELQTLFNTKSVISDPRLQQCKPDLSVLMGSIGDLEIVEAEGSSIIPALLEIYHMLLRDRHWAVVHSAISAFGYFAARTTISQLYRFVPDDAALSFDINSGSNIEDERFMSEMKAFLEKEGALTEVAPSKDQLDLLANEAQKLKELIEKSLSIEDSVDNMEIDSENPVNKKRKLPDEISEGMALLRNGLKIMGSGLSQWEQNPDSMEFQNFSSQLSCLEDVISHLATFTETR
ncbi:hypothetical protein ACHQM5_027812 [Ranunculus cassubicifolius]